MITKSETKTLILSFADNTGKKINYTLQRPKADLEAYRTKCVGRLVPICREGFVIVMQITPNNGIAPCR